MSTTETIERFGLKSREGWELRTLRGKSKFELRAAADASVSKVGILSGYAALFNVPSFDLGYGDQEVYEVVAPGTFAKCLASRDLDVRCLVDHETDSILGRTKSSTLTVKEDGVGLYFECDLPDTSKGRDIAESVRRRDITDNSFGFDVVREDWEYKDGVTVRTILEAVLWEISPCTFPAYPGTSLSLRNAFGAMGKLVKPPEGLDSERARRLRLLEASL